MLILKFVFRLVHSGPGKGSPQSGVDLSFATRTGTQQGIESHLFKTETSRDLSLWTRSLVQGCHNAAELSVEVTTGKSRAQRLLGNQVLPEQEKSWWTSLASASSKTETMSIDVERILLQFGVIGAKEQNQLHPTSVAHTRWQIFLRMLVWTVVLFKSFDHTLKDIKKKREGGGKTKVNNSFSRD